MLSKQETTGHCGPSLSVADERTQREATVRWICTGQPVRTDQIITLDQGNVKLERRLGAPVASLHETG